MTTTAACTAPRHGTISAYDWWGCRCPEAREAWRIYRKRLRYGIQPPALIPATGTVRRVQALVALGYCWRTLAGRMGITSRRMADLGTLPITGQVHRTTAARILALYDELSATPGPDRYALTVARRYGFHPPLAWDDDTIDDPTAAPNLGGDDADLIDEVAIRRVLEGDRTVRLTPAEQAEALRVGVASGMRLYEVAAVLRMSYNQAKYRNRTTVSTTTAQEAAA